MTRRHFLRSLIGLPLIGLVPLLASEIRPKGHFAVGDGAQTTFTIHAVDASDVERLFARYRWPLSKDS